MGNFENRSEKRKRACVQAFASDQQDTFDIKCIIRDVSEGGCMIVGSNVHELPDQIQLVPEGFKQPILGKIVWRRDKRAGVCFTDPSIASDLERMHERLDDAATTQGEDDALVLGAVARPSGYADRLSRYRPNAK